MLKKANESVILNNNQYLERMDLVDKLENILLKAQKPARYTGGELNSVMKTPEEVDLRFAFCFPDTYEVGMSHLGMKILYSLLNQMEGVWCERVFAPWPDMEAQLRSQNISLFGLESQQAITDFDFVGFTLQYEMSFTNILNMLSLAKIPLLAADRTELKQIVMGGGPCACNPEPLADFFDLFCLGEGEEVTCEVVELYRECRKQNHTKAEFLEQAAQIQGVYVPSLYEVSYTDEGCVKDIKPLNNAPAQVTKRIIQNLDEIFYPQSFVVPFIEIVHDRVMTEVLRGCIRGCRFCQAGYIYRPVREKSPDTIEKDSRTLCESTGYDEISLSSLSTSDYTKLSRLLEQMMPWANDKKISVNLPSQRVDSFSAELMDKLNQVRRSGLTFAPEAGTQRMRDVINKNVCEADLLNTCAIAFEGGWISIKLYFMIGLPEETMEDIEGIAALAQKVVDAFYHNPNRPKGKQVSVTVSVACFVPKPFTPFQWCPQNSMEEFSEKQRYLKEKITSKKIRYKYHENKTSFLEAVFARGDRRLCKVLSLAYEKGCKFDSWDEYFDFERWMSCFEELSLSPEFYANRQRSLDEVLPWSHLNYGVTQNHLKKEYQKALDAATTPNCREACSGCGAAGLMEGGCRHVSG